MLLILLLCHSVQIYGCNLCQIVDHSFAIPSPFHEPGFQKFSSNPKSFTCFITCLIFDKLLGTFLICSTWGLVRCFSGGMFHFLFPMSHIFIVLIIVRPLENSHLLVKGLSLPWCKQTIHFCFFDCCLVLSRMIDACIIADRKGLNLIQLHQSNNYPSLPQGQSECRPQKKRVAVITGTGGDASHILVQGGKHGRVTTRYTGTK